MPKRRPTLPDSLTSYIDDRIAGDLGEEGVDPLYANADIRRLTKLTRSAETRSGLVLQRALVEALKCSTEYTVFAPRTFPVTDEVKRELDVHDISFCRDSLHLPLTANVSSATELDLVAIRHRDRSAAVYEIRRAGGRLGYRASRAALRKVVGAQMLLRAWIRRESGIVVENVSSYMVLYYGKTGTDVFPPDMVITRDTIDAHFGVSVRKIIEAAVARHGEHVDVLVERVVESIRNGASPGGKR